MKQNLLTITIDRAYLKKFQKKLNFFKIFSNKFKFFIKSAYLLAIPAMMLRNCRNLTFAIYAFFGFIT